MKRALLLILLVAGVGAGAFGLTRWLGRPAEPADSLDWMAAEFSLGPEQRAAIARLHADYAPVCERHCEEIYQARVRLDAASEAETAVARAELVRLEAVCTESTLAHLRAVAAHMEPAAARRFLKLVEPKLAGHGHEAPLGLP